MNKKCLLILPLALSLLVACDPAPEELDNQNGDNYKDVLPETTNDGQILHCFNWTYKQILENLVNIKNSGFKAVQTSPVQQPKSGGAFWWSYYQPVSLSIGTSSPLGTKEDLKKLCTEAEKLGIDVICDIVFNHLANVSETEKNDDGTPTVSEEVKIYEPEIYALRNDSKNPTFHHEMDAKGSGAITQKYDYGNLPDLNTAHPLVQEKSLGLLKECIDVGVDGFRFDAAKHIETPTDPDHASDFWVKTLEEAKKYYKQKTNRDLYAYGEVLADVGGPRNIDCYTAFMHVTDTSYIGNELGAFLKQKPQMMVDAPYGKATDAKNLVTWVESHDTYVASKSHEPEERLKRMWSILSSRKDSRGLFFARCDSDNSVGKIASYTYEDELVAKSNMFHNRYAGYDEYQFADEKFYINERYNGTDSGCVIVTFNNKNLEFKTNNFKNMKTQVYFDQVSGQRVNVINGKASFTMDKSGVAILTPSKNELRPSLVWNERSGSFNMEKTVKVEVKNAKEAYYTINDGEKVNLKDGKNEIILKKEMCKEDKTLSLKITVSNGDFISTRSGTYRTVDLIEGGFNIVNFNEKYFDENEVYIWRWSPMDAGYWTKDYTRKGSTILFNADGLTGFLIGIFPKDYVISDTSKWDSKVIKQTQDIKGALLKDGFFDASGF